MTGVVVSKLVGEPDVDVAWPAVVVVDAAEDGGEGFDDAEGVPSSARVSITATTMTVRTNVPPMTTQRRMRSTPEDKTRIRFDN